MGDHDHDHVHDHVHGFPPPLPRVQEWIAHFEIYEDGTIDAAKGGTVPPPRPSGFARRIASLIVDVTDQRCQVQVVKYDRVTGDVIHDLAN